MKILFLDDDHNRIDIVKKRWANHELCIAETAEEAIAFLMTNEFDLASLDHDLGGQVYQSSGKNTGYEVAQYIAKMDNPPPIVIVHSWNYHGAQNMIQELKNVTEVDYQRFEI